MTTELAFTIMLAERGVYKKLGITRGAVGKIRYDIKKGNSKIALGTKVIYLQRAGFKICQEMKWTISDDTLSATDKKDVDYLRDFPGLTYIGKKLGMSEEIIRRANKAIIEDPTRFKKIYKQVR